MLGIGFKKSLLCFGLFFAVAVGSRGDDQSLPDSMTAAILVKLLELEEHACKIEDLRIHVVESEALAESIRRFVGSEIGDGQLKEVTIGGDLPENGTDVVVFEGNRNVSTYVDYARKHGALSVSTLRHGAELGASLAIYDDEGLPGVMLNHESSIKEGRKWKPEILDIAELFKK